MRNRLRVLLGLSALYVGFAVSPAEAAETRTGNFLITCDGTNKNTFFTVGGLGNSVNRFIQGVEIILFENHGGLQYVLVSAGVNKQLVALSAADNSRSRDFNFSLFIVTTDASGNVPIFVAGACNPGAGQVQGTVTIIFFN